MISIDEVVSRARRIRDGLPDVGACPIDRKLDPVPPFIGNGEIRLIFIGQDPTVESNRGRAMVGSTLRLEEGGVLKVYIERICKEFGCRLENVYATNVFKYFYEHKPAVCEGFMAAFEAHIEPNLKLLREELETYPGCPVVTLGQPVLSLIAGPDKELRKYWNYKGCGYRKIDAGDNKLGRVIYPFPHYNSSIKDKTGERNIYSKENFKSYVAAVRGEQLT